MEYTFLKTPGTKIDESLLCAAERKYGFIFPAVLRDFFENHYNASIESRVVDYQGSPFSVDRFIYPDAEEGFYAQLIEGDRKHNNIPETYIPFASDVFDTIFYCDSESGMVYLCFPDSLDINFVCGDISVFFDMINNDKLERMLNMNKIDYVPLGSVVLLTGATKKMMIISRAINVNNNGKTFFFDYGAVAYPEGLVGDEMAYFNHDNIENVIFRGYDDIENNIFVGRINKYLADNDDIVRGNAENWEE